MKMTATRSRSERLNASRNKNAGNEEANKQKKAAVSVLSLARSGWSKEDYPRKLLDERQLVGSKQQ